MRCTIQTSSPIYSADHGADPKAGFENVLSQPRICHYVARLLVPLQQATASSEPRLYLGLSIRVTVDVSFAIHDCVSKISSDTSYSGVQGNLGLSVINMNASALRAMQQSN